MASPAVPWTRCRRSSTGRPRLAPASTARGLTRSSWQRTCSPWLPCSTRCSREPGPTRASTNSREWWMLPGRKGSRRSSTLMPLRRRSWTAMDRPGGTWPTTFSASSRRASSPRAAAPVWPRCATGSPRPSAPSVGPSVGPPCRQRQGLGVSMRSSAPSSRRSLGPSTPTASSCTASSMTCSSCASASRGSPARPRRRSWASCWLSATG
mmetsp:Transcript_4727/g.15849  ORF Transcript_4727/g.15849 Transcript_4727/m.15849 type:complete len:209 (+) Transcript_4727:1298-1924(+)